MTDIIIIASVLGIVTLLMGGPFILLGRAHGHCWHTIPGEEGLQEQRHGRFVRTVRVRECCECSQSIKTEVIAEQIQETQDKN